MRGRLEGLTEGDWRVIDRLFAATLLVLGVIEAGTSGEPAGIAAGAAVVTALMALLLLWRRTHPLAVLAAFVALAAIGEGFFVGPPDLLTQVLMLLTVNYSVGAHADGRRGLAGLGIGVAGVAFVAALYDPTDLVFPIVFFVVTPWLVGRLLRNTMLTARELAERAELAEHAREDEERRAVMAERNRVARELHDVLAHNLSVVVVQAGAARRIVERDPERAAEVAALIELTGREALAELRHLFGPVRRSDALTPQRAARSRRSRAPRHARRPRRPRGRPADRGRAGAAAGRRGPHGLPRRPGGAHERAQARRRRGRDRVAQLRAERARALGRGRRRRARPRAPRHARRRPRPRWDGGAGGALRRAAAGRPARGGGFAVRARLPTRPLVPGAELRNAPKRTVTA